MQLLSGGKLKLANGLARVVVTEHLGERRRTLGLLSDKVLEVLPSSALRQVEHLHSVLTAGVLFSLLGELNLQRLASKLGVGQGVQRTAGVVGVLVGDERVTTHQLDVGKGANLTKVLLDLLALNFKSQRSDEKLVWLSRLGIGLRCWGSVCLLDLLRRRDGVLFVGLFVRHFVVGVSEFS